MTKSCQIWEIVVYYHVVYYRKYPEGKCTEDYAGETARHLIECMKGHSCKDSK